jgi:hypothetical protein
MKPSEAPWIVNHDMKMQVVLDDGNRVPLRVSMTYRTGDALAVTATFHTSEGEITWRFARELLRDGLRGPAGEGDILVRPSHPARAQITLTLRSESGAAVIEAARKDISAFIAEIYHQVPEDFEWMYLDIDRTIDDILAQGI